mmetsp:Transcript_70974/g.166171  ORF Transcript_70974/g.166171 Transcript_70974/m.166171 type:complete len:254 (+) Transcript_70974:610-1371(+)
MEAALAVARRSDPAETAQAEGRSLPGARSTPRRCLAALPLCIAAPRAAAAFPVASAEAVLVRAATETEVFATPSSAAAASHPTVNTQDAPRSQAGKLLAAPVTPIPQTKARFPVASAPAVHQTVAVAAFDTSPAPAGRPGATAGLVGAAEHVLRAGAAVPPAASASDPIACFCRVRRPCRPPHDRNLELPRLSHAPAPRACPVPVARHDLQRLHAEFPGQRPCPSSRRSLPHELVKTQMIRAFVAMMGHHFWG